jgi:hypothetical protein
MLTPRNHGAFASPHVRPTAWVRLCASSLSFAVLLLITSCADLSAIAKFADSAKSAADGFSDIAKDFAGSATRRSLYVSDEEKPKVLEKAANYKALEPDMMAAQKVLTDYISGLADIATDNPASRDASITATQGGLEKVGMSTDQATAGVGLVSKLVDAAVNGYRAKKAGKVIRECNPLLQDYLKGLEQIVGTDYTLVLNNEKISAQGYYEGLLHRYGDKEPLAAVTIRVQMQHDLDGIEKKQKAAEAYVKILTDIGAGHQKLYDGGEHMDAKQMIGTLEPYIKDIATQSVAVVKAF